MGGACTAGTNSFGYWYNDSAYKVKNTRQMAEGWAEICIVPRPGYCKQYYVFTAADATNNFYENVRCGFAGGQQKKEGYKPYYALIDVSGQTPYGAPTGETGLNITNTLGLPGGNPSHIVDLYKSTSTPSNDGGNCSPHTGGIQYACTKLISNSYRLLFVTNDNEVIVYKITNTGITCLYNYDLTQYPSSSGNSYFGTLIPGTNIAELECYVDSTNNIIKVAIEGRSNGTYNTSGVALAFANFYMTTSGSNLAGQMVSGSFTNVYAGCSSCSDMSSRISGVEFSPNGSYVYLVGNYTGIRAYSYSSPTTSYAISTGSSNVNDFVNSQIELAKDGNLYLIGQTGSSTPRLAKITNPNNPNTTAAFTDNVLTLTGYSSVVKATVSAYYYTTDNNSVFFLPDQIDQEVYGSNFNTSNLTCCLFYNAYDKQYYTAGQSNPSGWTGSTQTWTSGSNPLNGGTGAIATIGEELRIPAGKTITITNMTLKFSPQARLIIENAYGGSNGGKLILDGCTITVDNRCGNDMWPGIQVWGNPASTQTAANQGWLYTKNNTVIQNAYVGVLAGYNKAWYSNITPAPPLSAINFPAIDSGQGGAIIQCDNTTFLNNQRHAVFLDYAQGGSTYKHFNLCAFNVNAALLNTSVKPKAFVSFYNYTPGTYVFPLSGCSFLSSYSTYSYILTGLWSSNSAYWVDRYNSGTSYTRSTFAGFLYGIYSKNTSGSATIQANYSTFTNNKIGIYLGNINNATVTNDTTKIWNCGTGNVSGLYLDNCTGYKVENNNYTKGTCSNSSTRYGILVYNSGAFVNCIYNNTFDNVYKGSQAQYRNYINNFTGGVAHNSGGGLVYLCNTFALTSTSGGFADIYVPGTGQSANVGGTYSGTDTAGIGYNQGTGSTYPISGGNQFSHIGGTAYDFYIDTTSAKAWRSVYEYCGTCGTSYNPLKVHNVAANAISSNVNCATDPYSNGLRTVNPLTTMLNGSETYKTLYDSITTAMNNLPNGSKKKADLSIYRGDIFSARHRLLDEAIHLLLDNGADTSLLKVKALMKIKALELPSRSALETALAINDSALAANALAAVVAKEGQSNYVKVHTLLLKNLSKTPQQIMQNQAAKSMLQVIALDSSDHAAYLKAHILLSAVGLSNYKLYYQESNPTTQGSRLASNVSTEQVEVIASSLYNAPNPFKESTEMEAFVAEKTQNAYLIITDMLGREVNRYSLQQGNNSITLQATDLHQSIMFATLIVNGVKIKTNKMVLIK